MSITVYGSDKVIEYVPAYGGNRDSINPCVVGLKYVSFGKTREYAEIYSKESEGVTKSSDLTLITQIVQKKQFLENVVSVSGLFDGDREVTSVAEFYDIAPQPLVFEIMAALEDPKKIEEGMLKKSTSPKANAKGKRKKES